MIEDDLSGFYAADEFASACTRQREGEADVPFLGHWSHADEDALDGRAISGVHRLHYATAAVELLQGDVVVSDTVTYEVLRADRANDGRETLAELRVVPPEEPAPDPEPPPEPTP